MSKVKWGILSTAKIAETQVVPVIQASHDGAAHGVASRSGKEQDFAEKFDIPKTYSSYHELLEDEGIDAVYIPLPNNMHAEWCIKTAEAKKHILSEKPIALSVEEFSRIKEACDKHDVYFMEGFMYRFHPQHQKVKELMDDGVIGDILTIRSRFHFTIKDLDTDIRLKPELGGGVTYDIGSYSINVMNYLMGGKPDSVTALADYEKVDTKMTAVMKYGEVFGLFDCTFSGPFIQEYEVTGTEGIINVPFAFRPDTNEGVGVIEIVKGGKTEKYELQKAQYASEVESFHKTVIDGEPLRYSVQEMEDHIQTVEAVLRSTKSGQVINL